MDSNLSSVVSSSAISAGLWVEPSIHKILSMDGIGTSSIDEQKHNIYSIDHATLKLETSHTIELDYAISLEELVSLAKCAERTLYGDDGKSDDGHLISIEQLLPPPVAVPLLREENVVFASLIALNYLESAIRLDTGYKTGKAPLLKVMIGQIKVVQLRPILRGLLLPTWNGINLRNLVWHGFVGTNLPRAWLALIVVLLVNLQGGQSNNTAATEKEQEQKKVSPDQRTLPVMMKKAEANTSEQQLSVTSRERIRSWLMESHRDLWDLAMSWWDCNESSDNGVRKRPACCLAVFCILLEHHLRLEWCKANHREADTEARHGSYYVTLDGHGQRKHHNLVLYPYYHQQEEGVEAADVISSNNVHPNQLVYRLGHSTMAFLTDLFASPCGGPNVRAALAHGIWDHRISRELLDQDGNENESMDKTETEYLVHLINLVLRGLEACSMASADERRALLSSYQPQYSYTAATQRLLLKALHGLDRLKNLKTNAVSDFASLTVAGGLSLRTNRLLNKFPNWARAQSYFEEYGTNSKLADCDAVRSLLEGIEVAANQFSDILEGAKTDCDSPPDKNLPSRRLKQARRRLQMSSTVYTLYAFAMQVAVLFVETALDDKHDDARCLLDRSVALQSVKRTRMCVSTFSTYLTLNPERSMKCAREYAKSKVVKAVLACLVDEKEVVT